MCRMKTGKLPLWLYPEYPVHLVQLVRQMAGVCGNRTHPDRYSQPTQVLKTVLGRSAGAATRCGDHQGSAPAVVVSNLTCSQKPVHLLCGIP